MRTPLNYRSFFNEEDEELPGDPFWGNAGAGALFLARDTGRLLVFLRSDAVNEPGTWNLVGGKLDYGENAKQAVSREVEEETGYDGDYKMYLIHTFRHRDFRYDNFLVIVPFEFTPRLNWEHDSSEWVEYGDWPRPLHFGLADVIKHAGHKLQRISAALKKRSSMRTGVKTESVDVPPPVIVQPSVPNTAPYNLTNAYIVAATLWGEARGEGERGMQAVLNVIMNRAHNNFNKAKDIALKPKQFSMWNGVSDPEATALDIANKNRGNKTYQTIIRLVDMASRGNLPDITGGAKFYFNPKKANPSWAKKMQKTATIGNHTFYKLPARKI